MSASEKYLAFFRRVYTDTPSDGVQRYPGFVLSWTWPAFFFTFPWLLFRKQYLLGFLFLGIITILGILSPISDLFQLVIWIVLKFVIALNAKSIYVGKAVTKIREARTRQIPVREWEAHLQLIGGVSHLGALLAIAIVVADVIVNIIILNGAA
ncbi:MAG: DUF2628 domain-containing protein [Alphaproteobacteria bacterium]|nr:DUF2628 domain-containing protein [Alphaproteobacteria bacterium]